MIEWVIISLVLVAVLLVVGVAAILVYQKRKGGKKKDVDYRAIFGAGLAFIPAGIAVAIATRNPGLIGITGLGVAVTITGVAGVQAVISIKIDTISVTSTFGCFIFFGPPWDSQHCAIGVRATIRRTLQIRLFLLPRVSVASTGRMRHHKPIDRHRAPMLDVHQRRPT